MDGLCGGGRKERLGPCGDVTRSRSQPVLSERQRAAVGAVDIGGLVGLVGFPSGQAQNRLIWLDLGETRDLLAALTNRVAFFLTKLHQTPNLLSGEVGLATASSLSVAGESPT